MKPSYSRYVTANENKFLKVAIDPDYVKKIHNFVTSLVIAKSQEQHHKIDSYNETKRFTTGFMGEAALESLLGIDIIDFSIGSSNLYHVPDIPGYKVGIKTVEYGKFPIIFKNNYYPQIICIKSQEYMNMVYICGLATKEVLNKYQSDELIIDPHLRSRNTKTGFYGFDQLIPIYSLADLALYRSY